MDGVRKQIQEPLALFMYNFQIRKCKWQKKSAINLIPIFVSFHSNSDTSWIIWLYHVCTSQYKHQLHLFPSKHALPIPSEREHKVVSDIDFWAKRRATWPIFFSLVLRRNHAITCVWSMWQDNKFKWLFYTFAIWCQTLYISWWEYFVFL